MWLFEKRLLPTCLLAIARECRAPWLDILTVVRDCLEGIPSTHLRSMAKLFETLADAKEDGSLALEEEKDENDELEIME